MSKILLVDDDESNRLTLSALLEDDGFAVRTVASYAEARRVLSSNGEADLVLLDQNLGDGLGTDLVPTVRGSMPGARIVLMSGSADLDTLSTAIADACFEKGGPFPALLALLRRLLGGVP